MTETFSDTRDKVDARPTRSCDIDARSWKNDNGIAEIDTFAVSPSTDVARAVHWAKRSTRFSQFPTV